jgi:hypothetical protein
VPGEGAVAPAQVGQVAVHVGVHVAPEGDRLGDVAVVLGPGELEARALIGAKVKTKWCIF